MTVAVALGPAMLIRVDAPDPSTRIDLEIVRGGAPAFRGATTLAELKRTPQELAAFLYRHNTFPLDDISILRLL